MNDNDIINKFKNKKQIKWFLLNKIEPEIYKYLLDRFNDLESIQESYYRIYSSDLYLFNCDFYIPEIDTYIEYNGSHYHHYHKFDNSNINDIKELNRLIECDKKSIRTIDGKKSQYKQIIYVWTNLDVRKRNMAKLNNLNFIEFWNINEFKKWINETDKKYM